MIMIIIELVLIIFHIILIEKIRHDFIELEERFLDIEIEIGKLNASKN